MVLSVVALLDLGLSRYLMLPSLRRRGLTRSSAESAGYAQIESIGVTAILTGLATDIPEAALIPGAIGIWGWTVARRYFAGWPEPGADA